MAGYDNGLDPRQHADIPVPCYMDQMTGEVSGMKVGLVEEGFSCCEKGVQDVVREAVNKYLRDAAAVEDTSVPLHSIGA